MRREVSAGVFRLSYGAVVGGSNMKAAVLAAYLLKQPPEAEVALIIFEDGVAGATRYEPYNVAGTDYGNPSVLFVWAREQE